jgi:hypothetical protein
VKVPGITSDWNRYTPSPHWHLFLWETHTHTHTRGLVRYFPLLSCEEGEREGGGDRGEVWTKLPSLPLSTTLSSWRHGVQTGSPPAGGTPARGGLPTAEVSSQEETSEERWVYACLTSGRFCFIRSNASNICIFYIIHVIICFHCWYRTSASRFRWFWYVINVKLTHFWYTNAMYSKLSCRFYFLLRRGLLNTGN